MAAANDTAPTLSASDALSIYFSIKLRSLFFISDESIVLMDSSVTNGTSSRRTDPLN